MKELPFLVKKAFSAIQLRDNDYFRAVSQSSHSMIPFNVPHLSGEEEDQVRSAIQNRNLAGDGHYTRQCENWLKSFTQAKGVLLTSSCTHALEMSALLLDIAPGDEIIMPSFTFVSSANAFVLRGARIIFVDIDPNTMNIDPQRIAAAITEKTKAILVMHYAGVSCAMEEIMDIADSNQLWVVEDAAQCIGAYYKDQHLGTIGHLGTFSFHSTKNIHCGEGGALLINNEKLLARAQVIREKGTNRQAFLNGEVDKYSWVDIGSSYLISELNAAFLYAQLPFTQSITDIRLKLWQEYAQQFDQLGLNQYLEIPLFPENCQSNGHIFYFKCESKKVRDQILLALKAKGITLTFHYVPLHSSFFGKKVGEFCGEDIYTTLESERLLRCPLYPDLSSENIHYICQSLKHFFS